MRRVRRVGESPGARDRHAERALGRLWKGLRIVDAKRDMLIAPNEADIRHAKPKDPGECVFAHACRRAFGSRYALILRSVAYADVPRPDGSRRVERFRLSAPAQRAVRKFDLKHEALPGGFRLLAPSPSDTFAGRPRYNARRGPDQPARRRGRKRGRPKLAALRNGVGWIKRAGVAVE